MLDLDAIYHGLLKTNAHLLAELDGRFPGVVRDGALDRKALGNIVFVDKVALADLNAITGGYILAETNRLLTKAEAEGRTLAAIDAINLLEGELPQRCTYTIAVTAPVEVLGKAAHGPGRYQPGVCPVADFRPAAQNTLKPARLYPVQRCRLSGDFTCAATGCLI